MPNFDLITDEKDMIYSDQEGTENDTDEEEEKLSTDPIVEQAKASRYKYTDPSSAQRYHRGNALQYCQAKSMIESYLIKENKIESILDIGSGEGRTCKLMANYYPDAFVTGIDISAYRIHFANERYKEESKINFTNCDAANISNLDTTYDLVVSFNAIHHVKKEEQQEVFNKINGVLNHGGQALLLVPMRTEKLHDSINEIVEGDKWKKFFKESNTPRSYLTKEYYGELAEQAGLTVEKSKNIKMGHKYHNVRSLANSIAGWLPSLSQLRERGVPKKERNNFLTDVANNIYKNLGEGDGDNRTVTLPVNQCLLVLKK